MPTSLPARPSDATLSVTKAARLLGVHPNTIRAWSDAGRLRYYRINTRGDRRYRSSDLQRFLTAAEAGARGGIPSVPAGRRGGRRRIDPATPARFAAARPAADDPPDSDPLDTERHRVDLEVAGAISRLTNTIDDSSLAIQAAVEAIRDAYGHHLVVAWEAHEDRLRPRASAGTDVGRALRLTDLPSRYGIAGQVLDLAAGRDRSGRAWSPGAALPATLVEPGHDDAGTAVLGRGRPELAVVIPGATEPWGVLSVVGDGPGSLDDRDLAFARVAAEGLGAMVGRGQRADGVAHLLHRAEALQRVATDIGSRLDLDQILAGLVDHAMVLFDGDRAAVFLQQPDGRIGTEVSRGLSKAYLGGVRDFPTKSLPTAAIAAGRPLFSLDYRVDSRGEDMRASVIQEGFVSICTAPLLDGSDLLGLLNIYHDSPHPWTSDELDTIGALAAQATVAIRTAQDYARMATWAAQLQSIQQLSARLSRLSTVAEIGDSIATELRQLIDYHNVRVYRLEGRDLVPVAMKGQVGEYVDETAD
ncbi:MAG: GAF domain-containing protein, partial [Chloroflexi bacterium]|nr:GAF domain-containing protein [Chloroflexota bacterium]